MARPDSSLSNRPIDPPSQRPPLSMTAMRILPLGNSITYGYLSTDGNGYRKALFEMLTENEAVVQYIGSVQAGNMTDNRNEGHPGAVITQIGAFANQSLSQRPNVILVMAGTNDMVQSLNVSDAPKRLGALLDGCHTACPDAVILVAQLTPAADPTTQANVNAYNPEIPGLVATKVKNGAKVLTVDMTAYVSIENLGDGLHPNDIGYENMAKAWMEGLREAVAKGWVTPPV
jgi:lysophospholipase L1-like esterase